MESDGGGQKSDLEGDRNKGMQRACHGSPQNLSWVERKVKIKGGDGE